MRDAKFILALDQGTTSSRAMVFDETARVRSVSQLTTTQDFPRPGWVNQDASEIWSTTLAVAQDALKRASIDGHRVAAIGIVNQRETLVVWNRETSAPAAPAIVWQSRQSQPQIDALLARGMGATYQNTTGLVPDAYFTASKLAWLLDADPELRRRADAGDILAGTVDSWLLWNLTHGEVHATDVSNASRTMLFDIRTLDWSQELLRDLAIPSQMLPRVVPSAGIAGLSSPQLFGAEIPVSGIAGDQQAALFGQTCFEPGDAKNTYGTGAFLLMNTGKVPQVSTHNLLSTIAWQVGDSVAYALEGSVFICGAAVEWLRDGLGIIDAVPEVEALAASVTDSDGVTVVPALTGLRRTALGRCGTGHDSRSYQRFDRGPYCPGHIGSHRVPDTRRYGGDECGLRNSVNETARRWGRRSQRSLDANPSGCSRRPSHPAGECRNDGCRRGVPRRSGPGALARPIVASWPMGCRSSLRARGERRSVRGPLRDVETGRRPIP